MKLSCPICKKTSEFEDVGVGWKCPNCTGYVFSEYTDEHGKKHRYSDHDIHQSELANQTHVFDLDATDMMTGSTEPGPFYSETFAKNLTFQLTKLADKLDEKGHKEEADKIDEVLGSEDFIDPELLPDHFIHSLSGEPMANL
jgi:rubredoxin